MIRIENHLGTIEIAPEYFRYLIGNAAASCYGVAGMVKSGPKQGLRSVFSKRSTPTTASGCAAKGIG